jgi:class 3 adenylate cyclase
MAGVKAENAELARTLEDLREQQRSIGAVLRAVTRSAGLQPVLDEVVEACARLCNADNAAVWLLEDGLLHSVAHRGEPEGADYDAQHPHALDRTTAAGRTAVVRGPVHIPDILADPEYVYPGPRAYRAMLGVPIVFEDELMGVVVVVRREPQPFTNEHIALLGTFADQAAIALRNARLMESVERQRTELSRFVSPQVAQLITSKDGEQLLAGHRAYISCLFCDLRGFTAFVETAGDGLLVFFNDPLPVENHELEAIRLALAAQEGFAQLANGWRRRGTDLGLGIGIEAGYATLGRIGFEERHDYAALGPVANLASRLSTHAAAGQTLIGQHVFAAVEERVITQHVGNLDLKGFARPVAAYEAHGLR